MPVGDDGNQIVHMEGFVDHWEARCRCQVVREICKSEERERSQAGLVD